MRAVSDVEPTPLPRALRPLGVPRGGVRVTSGQVSVETLGFGGVSGGRAGGQAGVGVCCARPSQPGGAETASQGNPSQRARAPGSTAETRWSGNRQGPPAGCRARPSGVLVKHLLCTQELTWQLRFRWFEFCPRSKVT